MNKDYINRIKSEIRAIKKIQNKVEPDTYSLEILTQRLKEAEDYLLKLETKEGTR